MRRGGVALLGLLCGVSCLYGAVGGEGCAGRRAVRANITDYVRYAETRDGVRRWDAALRKALADAHEVRFPAGDYPFGETIFLDSDSTLAAEGGAFIGHAPDFDGILLRNMCGATNLSITGGTWYDHPRDKKKYGNYRGTMGDNSQMFRFLGCRGLYVGNLCISNAPSFSLQAGGVTNLVVENVRIEKSGADGVHLNGCISNALVRNVHGQMGDDVVAVNAWDWPRSTECYGPSSDIVIDDVSGSYGAIRILPGKIRKRASDPWTDCSVSRLTIRNCHHLRGVKIMFQGMGSRELSAMGRCEELHFENMTILPASYTDNPKLAEKPGGQGHFGAFSFGCDVDRVSFRNITLKMDADRMPSAHFLSVGPWWWEPAIRPVVRNVRIAGVKTVGKAPAELLHEIVFDSAILGPRFTGRGRFENVTMEP